MNKNYKEDFVLDIQLLNHDGSPIAVPDIDFDVKFAANASSYRCGRKDGEYYNCTVLDDGRLRVTFDGHGLLPCCSLRGYATWHLPDDAMPDGIRDLPQIIDTGVTLTVGPSDRPADAEVSVLLPYIKGENGSLSDLTPEEREIFVKEIIDSLPEEAEAIPPEEVESIWESIDKNAQP